MINLALFPSYKIHHLPQRTPRKHLPLPILLNNLQLQSLLCALTVHLPGPLYHLSPSIFLHRSYSTLSFHFNTYALTIRRPKRREIVMLGGDIPLCRLEQVKIKLPEQIASHE